MLLTPLVVALPGQGSARTGWNPITSRAHGSWPWQLQLSSDHPKFAQCIIWGSTLSGMTLLPLLHYTRWAYITRPPRISRLVIMYLEVAVMAIVAIAAGWCALKFSWDMRLVSSCAAGIILGTAFMVVVPEGIEVAQNEVVGFPLLVGFLVMYCIDAAIKLQKSKTRRVAVNQLEFEDTIPAHLLQIAGYTISATSVGLIIHSLADGVAFGAAALLPDAKLRFSVLVAVLVHKAPAAFSFATLLKAQHVPTLDIKRDIILFALAAPASALLIYWLVPSSGPHFMWWAGQGLLFSGGSFLFVAMHAMPTLETHLDVAAVLGGITLPLLTSLVKD